MIKRDEFVHDQVGFIPASAPIDRASYDDDRIRVLTDLGVGFARVLNGLVENASADYIDGALGITSTSDV